MATRFLDIPVRVALREQDSVTGSYPTIVRTGDLSRLGKSQSRYDDTETIEFSYRSTNILVNYPELLPVGSEQLSRRNDLGSITAPAVVRPGLGDHLATFRIGSSEENLGPFVENNLPELQEDEFFMIGTSEEVLPGFSSPLRSKTIIRIDISNSQEHVFTRNPSRNDINTDGEFYLTQSSGFSYYNFVRKAWEDIGLTDPATGQSILFDWAVEVTGSNSDIIVSGTNNWCQQFQSPKLDVFDTQAQRLANTNLKDVGKPTVTMQAPFANRYHATSSQTLDLSDYISHPFLLEKAVIRFGQVDVRRMQDWTHYLESYRRQSAERYMDDYVVFLYRQQNTGYSVDSPKDVSGSQRYLICSASMCFYNSMIKRETDVNPVPEPFSPLHNPSFSYDFRLTNSPPLQEGHFSGEIQIEMIPHTMGPGLTGQTYVTASNEVISQETRENAIIHGWWPGGTTSRSFLSASYTGRVQTATTLTGRDVTFGKPTYNEWKLDPRLMMQSVQLDKYDHRAHAFLGKGVQPSDQNPMSAQSPYLLMPNDKLVLGFDCLIGMRENQRTEEMTGSFFKLLPSECSLILYGSLLHRDREFHDTLNQPLTSDAIHEDLHFSNPVMDQHNVEPREVYYGTYLDDVIEGGIFGTTSRRLVGSVTSNRVGATGSIARSVSLVDQSEIFYDSIPPDLGEYIIRAGGVRITTTSLGSVEGNVYQFGSEIDGENGATTLKFREPVTPTTGVSMPYPYVGDPQRVFDDTTQLFAVQSIGGIVDKQFIKGEMLRDILFRRGFRRKQGGSSTSDAFFHARVTGSNGFRYGMISNKLLYSKAIFRFDHYGQFRDMLEQRPMTTFYDNVGRSQLIRGRAFSKLGKKVGAVNIRFVSGSETIDPINASYSLNLSVAATSSEPYSDSL